MNAAAKPIAKQMANDVRRDFQRILISRKHFPQRRKGAKRCRVSKASLRLCDLCAFAGKVLASSHESLINNERQLPWLSSGSKFTQMVESRLREIAVGLFDQERES